MADSGIGALQDQRRALRYPTNFPGEIRCGRKRSAVTVSDLSAVGALLRGKDFPDPGTEIAFIARALEVVATVIWVRADACGIEFHRSVQPLEVVRQNAAEMARFRSMRAAFGPDA